MVTVSLGLSQSPAHDVCLRAVRYAVDPGPVAARGDVRRSLLVSITRATTINDFAKLGTALGGRPTIVERLGRRLLLTYKGMYRFYGRGASGRYQLDVRQIRAGFLEVETAQERVRRFRLERITQVLAGETPVRIGVGAKLIFHALPLTRLEVWPRFLALGQDVSRLITTNVLAPLEGAPGNWRYNLDGFVVHTTRSDKSRETYTQLFRDGGIEAAGAVLYFDEHRRGFYGGAIEDATIPTLARTQQLWKLLGVTGPILFGLTVSGVKGWKMLHGPIGGWEPEETFDVDLAVIPEVVAQDESAPAEQVLKPLFDLAWNGGGWSRSPSYNPATGERQKRR